MTTWDDKTAERFAELTRHARDKANTLGDDGNLISEPFRRVPGVMLGETWQQIPSTDNGLISPDYDSYGVSGEIGTRFELERLHSYLPSGLTGSNSVQAFFVVSSAPSGHGQDDIEAVQKKNLISPVFSPNKSNAAEIDTNVRGFELVLYPAKSSPGGGIGDLLVADEAKPIPVTADPGGGTPTEMAPGLGDIGFWGVDYMSGLVRFSRPPLNGSGGIMNPNNVYGNIGGEEVPDGYGAITMFATYYQYSGTLGQVDESNFVVVGDGYISNGTFEGSNQNTFQSALDSLTHGGTVFVKEGDYTFTSPVELSSHKNVFGLNKRVNITAPTDEAAFNIGGDNIGLEGLTVRTNNSSGGSCIKLIGDDAGEILENIRIVDNDLYCRHDAYGVELSPTASSVKYKNVEIRNNVFRNESNNGLFVTVGASGEIQVSSSGTTWTHYGPDASYTGAFNSVAQDNSELLVAVGASGEIQTSPDGTTWAQQTADASYAGIFYDVTYDGSGLWCAVGSSGEIQTSPDGTTWTQRTAAASYAGSFFSIAHDGSGLWCAVGASGEIQTSPDGTTWTQRTAASSFAGTFYEVAHDGSGLWCAVGLEGFNGEIQTSSDGTTWTRRYNPAFVFFRGVAHDGSGLWVTVGQGGVIYTSLDGTTWTQQTADASYTDTFNSVVHDGSGLWIAVGDTGEIQTSPDGTTWTQRTADASFGSALNSVIFSPVIPAVYIGERYNGSGDYVIENMSIVENQFDQPSTGSGSILLESHLSSLNNMLVSQNIGAPNFNLLGVDGYATEVKITNNNFKTVQLDDLQNSLFSNNVIQGNVTFSGIDKSVISDNDFGGELNATSIIRTNLIGNRVEQNNLGISASCHIWDGYISADGPNVYIDDNLLPKITGQELGSRNNRWDGYFTRLDIGDATTVITDGYVSSNRKLEISAGLNDVEIHSRVVQNGPNNSSVVLDNGSVRFVDTTTSLATVITDGYISSDEKLEISAGTNDVEMHSRVIQRGPNNSSVTLDNGDVRVGNISIKNFLLALGPSNWTQQTPDASFAGTFYEVAHDGSGLWCAVGASGEIQTSLDGTTWTQKTPDASYTGDFRGIAHDGSGLWCAVGVSGEIQTSSDGTTWAQRTPDASYTGDFRDIAHDGSGLWIAVGTAGEIQTSSDGTTWAQRTPDASYGEQFSVIAYDGSGLWCAVGGDTGPEIQTSPDGTTWTQQTPDASYTGGFRGIAHDGSGLWVIVGTSTGEIQTSPDGTTWTQRTADASYTSIFWSVAHDGFGLWCITGNSGEIQTSPDGVTWTHRAQYGSFVSGFFSIAHDSSGLWIAVGSSGEIQTSLRLTLG